MSKLGMRCLRLGMMVGGLCVAPAMYAAHVNPHALNTSKPKSTKLSESQHTRRRMRHLASSHSTTAHPITAHATTAHSATVRNAGSLTLASSHLNSHPSSHHKYHERFFVSSCADGLTGGD